MSWPLEPEAIRQFAEGLEEIVVIEEKRGVVESQLKEQLYNWQAAAPAADRRQAGRARRVAVAARTAS